MAVPDPAGAAPFESAFARDPDLDPIAMPEPPAAPAPVRHRPVIAPAEPRNWSTAVPLKHPITVDGVLLGAITIRMATGEDISELMIEDGDETSLNVRARARICGVHPDVLTRGLSAEDAERVGAACRPFLPPALMALEDLELGEIAGGVEEPGGTA